MRVEPADENNFVDLFGLKVRVFQRLLARANGAIDDRLNQLFVLLAGDLAQVALATGQFDVKLDRRLRGERDLGVDHSFANGLNSFGVAAEVEIEVAANVVERDRDEQVIDVVAAEVGVAVRGDNFENAVVQFEDRNVECAAAQVINGDDPVLLLVEPVRERRGSRFVDESQHFKTGNAASVFCGLALGVVEVRRNGDHCLRDRTCEVAFRIALQLTKDKGRNLWRSERLISELDPEHFTGL